MKITFVSKLPAQARILCVVMGENAQLPAAVKALDEGRIAQAIKVAKFTGKRDQTLEIMAPSKTCDRLMLFGAGDATKISARELELTGGAVAGALGAAKVEKQAVDFRPRSACLLLYPL